MSTLNEALKELKIEENYSDLPKDPDFENVEFFPGYEGEEDALDFIHLNDITDYNLIEDSKLGGFILYWNDSSVNEDFEEIEDTVVDDSDYDEEADEFDRRNVEAEKEAIDRATEKEIKEHEEEIAKRAWMLNKVISNMNDENAYYGSWLYIWPDETEEDEVSLYFNTDDDLEELEDTFKFLYKKYHKGGLYTDDKDVIDFAHEIDKELGLKPIEVISVLN